LTIFTQHTYENILLQQWWCVLRLRRSARSRGDRAARRHPPRSALRQSHGMSKRPSHLDRQM